MHLRVHQAAKRFGHNARSLAYGAGAAMDKMLGAAHRHGQNVAPQIAGAIGGVLGGDAAAVTRVVSKAKRNVASYEELRKGFMGARE
jgi:hypothetical protein